MGSVRFSVGGTTPSLSDRQQKADSSAPAAPSRCPVAPLVDDTYSGALRVDDANKLSIASDSMRSPIGVEVAWALMYPMSSGVRPASIRAPCILRIAPLPSGEGEVMW